jgi:trehalose utilization protein
MSDGIRVTVWNEGRHEQKHEKVRALYPDGVCKPVADYLEKQPGIASVRFVQLDDADQGLSDDILNTTDVMTWWGHIAHGDVTDENVTRVQQAVLDGMGLVVLHSGHFSKVFKRLMGTDCDLKWREAEETERLWVVDPTHPIADGIPEYFEVAPAEMYGEYFGIPQPDQQVFISWFEGGEVFRSGCCWHRQRGKVFYFRPGHETYPIYKENETVLKVIYNGVKWAAPSGVRGDLVRGNHKPLEDID